MCPNLVDWLKWTAVGLIVGSVQFSVSVLNGFAIPIEYFIAPPISVVSNEIRASCFVPVIRFPLILFSIGVSALLDYSSRLLSQVRTYFSAPTLIVLLEFCLIVLLTSTVLLAILFNIILRDLFNCFSHGWFTCFA